MDIEVLRERLHDTLSLIGAYGSVDMRLWDEHCDAVLKSMEALSELSHLRSENEGMRKALASCQWYWPEDDTSSDACADSPWAIAEDWDVKPGDVFACSRGGVVETRYYAFLPPADDADSDDEFEVDEPSEEAALAKIQAEIARREALNEGSQS